MKVAVVTLATPDYVTGALNLFRSIRMNVSMNYKSVLLIPDTSIMLIRDETIHQTISVPSHLFPIFSESPTPRFNVTLLKLFLIKFFEESDFDRIIFFDSDMLCVGNIDYLFGVELNDYDMAAVRDFACYKYYKNNIDRLRLSASEIINSGCLVINRSVLNRISFFEMLPLLQVEDLSYDRGDQGYWNYFVRYFNISVSLIDIQFNYPLDVNSPLKLSLPKIIHYTGHKPWDDTNRILVSQKIFYFFYRKFSSGFNTYKFIDTLLLYVGWIVWNSNKIIFKLRFFKQI